MTREQVNVLLVEDDEIDVELVRRAMRPLEHIDLFVARNGEDALELLRTNQPAPLERPFLILLDINMPRMNGHEFMAELRSDPRLSDSVVFVLTTSESERDRRTAFDRNVAGYVTKQRTGPGASRLRELLEHYLDLSDLPPKHQS